MGRFLRAADRPLAELHDVALLDLDGVVYVGADAVPGAPKALAAARELGMRLAFVTNNAARTPQTVADHLTDLGIEASPAEIITSAQAAARYLADRLPEGARVLVVGTVGLEEALRERGLIPVPDASDHVDAVVQGYSPDLSWRQLAEGAVAINRGVPWVATNVDPTVPSPRGPLPGNGSLVAALRHATGAEPVVTGKPDPTMHRESVLRSGAGDPIVVGDRLDTDIEGANAVGCASMLVFSGVTEVAELLSAPPALRPDFVGADVSDLLVAHPAPELGDAGARCGDWLASVRGSEEDVVRVVLQFVGESGRAGTPSAGGSADEVRTSDELDAVRALCAAAWSESDRRCGAEGTRTAPVPAGASNRRADIEGAADSTSPRGRDRGSDDSAEKEVVVTGETDVAAVVVRRLGLG